ncbi:GNAT family N-acetyltransferase [Streptomyces spectabilis]|uniref:N-acetyltransferase n=1 Tax=Streptomyces spectabilis TaxID=68270 RepID=A0A5P2XH23_STRST|nr:GNAT family N-acetyltransferase [Streptomyces spectabilis]MBB5107009.1 ribosomal-protein-alanine N-acetyltransferase [Streptomyces spectabilis]MCI3906059.1 GNAT family N-acetyltransferase [Streptomyces spectabilis]QEV62954.1 N-acetyltransferase [Streptomyces spectabilis]GGV05089.1 acetyltransferase [Streptomyces spectabilis]
MRQPSPRHLAEGPRVGIRRFTPADGAEFTARARESQELHRPWLFPPTTEETYAAYARTLIEDPTRSGYLVCARESGAIAGFINVNNIVQGGFRCGALGYGVFAHAAGRGLMREGLGLVVDHAFGELRLHRLEINVQPGNAASIALARRLGFRLEGFSPDFLFIDGAWRDHQRWALTTEMRAASPTGQGRRAE